MCVGGLPAEHMLVQRTMPLLRLAMRSTDTADSTVAQPSPYTA
jgi:hypothetical protein